MEHDLIIVFRVNNLTHKLTLVLFSSKLKMLFLKVGKVDYTRMFDRVDHNFKFLNLTQTQIVLCKIISLI